MSDLEKGVLSDEEITAAVTFDDIGISFVPKQDRSSDGWPVKVRRFLERVMSKGSGSSVKK